MVPERIRFSYIKHLSSYTEQFRCDSALWYCSAQSGSNVQQIIIVVESILIQFRFVQCRQWTMPNHH